MKLNTIQILLLCIIHLSITIKSVKINFTGQKLPEVTNQSTSNYIIAQDNISNANNDNSQTVSNMNTEKYVKAKIIPRLNSDFLIRDEDELKKYYINLKPKINIEVSKINTIENKFSKETKVKISNTNKQNNQENNNNINNKDLFYNNFLVNFQKINSEFETFIEKSKILSEKLDHLTEKNINYTQEISKLRDSIYENTKTNSTNYLNSNIINNPNSINSNDIKKTNGQNMIVNNSTATNYNNEANSNQLHNTLNNTVTSIKENNQTANLAISSNPNLHSNRTEKLKSNQLSNLKNNNINKSDKKLETRLTQRQLLESKTSSFQGLNQNIVQALDNNKEMQELAVISNNLKKSIAEIKDFHKSFNENFNDFEEVFSEKNLHETKKKYESSLLFYNSLSLIMLAMLAGGLVGVIFILYFSFHSKDIKS